MCRGNWVKSGFQKVMLRSDRKVSPIPSEFQFWIEQNFSCRTGAGFIEESIDIEKIYMTGAYMRIFWYKPDSLRSAGHWVASQKPLFFFRFASVQPRLFTESNVESQKRFSVLDPASYKRGIRSWDSWSLSRVRHSSSASNSTEYGIVQPQGCYYSMDLLVLR